MTKIQKEQLDKFVEHFNKYNCSFTEFKRILHKNDEWYLYHEIAVDVEFKSLDGNFQKTYKGLTRDAYQQFVIKTNYKANKYFSARERRYK